MSSKVLASCFVALETDELIQLGLVLPYELSKQEWFVFVWKLLVFAIAMDSSHGNDGYKEISMSLGMKEPAHPSKDQSLHCIQKRQRLLNDLKGTVSYTFVKSTFWERPKTPDPNQPKRAWEKEVRDFRVALKGCWQ